MDELEFGFMKVLRVNHQSFAKIVLDFSLSANLSYYVVLETRIIVVTLFCNFLNVFQWVFI